MKANGAMCPKRSRIAPFLCCLSGLFFRLLFCYFDFMNPHVCQIAGLFIPRNHGRFRFLLPFGFFLSCGSFRFPASFAPGGLRRIRPSAFRLRLCFFRLRAFGLCFFWLRLFGLRIFRLRLFRRRTLFCHGRGAFFLLCRPPGHQLQEGFLRNGFPGAKLGRPVVIIPCPGFSGHGLFDYLAQFH